MSWATHVLPKGRHGPSNFRKASQTTAWFFHNLAIARMISEPIPGGWALVTGSHAQWKSIRYALNSSPPHRSPARALPPPKNVSITMSTVGNAATHVKVSRKELPPNGWSRGMYECSSGSNCCATQKVARSGGSIGAGTGNTMNSVPANPSCLNQIPRHATCKHFGGRQAGFCLFRAACACGRSVECVGSWGFRASTARRPCPKHWTVCWASGKRSRLRMGNSKRIHMEFSGSKQ